MEVSNEKTRTFMLDYAGQALPFQVGTASALTRWLRFAIYRDVSLALECAATIEVK